MTFDETVLTREETATFKLRTLYKKYGYSQFKMSKFEEYDLYARNKDFLISDKVITFTDTNGKLMALKPDVTLSIIKNHSEEKGICDKLFYSENVYRISTASQTYKEILQTGLECIGDIDTFSVGEVLTLAEKSLSLLSEKYVLDISHMGIVTSLMESMNIPEEQKQKIIKCINEKNTHSLKRICDECSVSPDDTDRLCSLVNIYGPISSVLCEVEKICINPQMKNAFSQLRDIYEILKFGGMADNVNIDFSVVNDMKYYNGIVFQGFVEGIPESILSGGQYDKLVKRMGKNSGAIGFAVYIDLLERYSKGEKSADVDTVLLYDESDAKALTQAAKELAATSASVLTLRKKPKNLKYNRLLKFEKGCLQEIENNG